MATTIKDRTRLDDATDLVGSTVDKYEIVGVVGQGGMGRVYEAINTSINKRVAIKCIDHELAKNEEANARFQREALAASAIESPHIVQIFDAGRTPSGLPYIVMELLRGRDLGKHIADRGRLPLGEALLVTAQILKGLHHAHAAGIVHRDLKPDNVFLVEREDEPIHVKLLDFGVSKISRPDDDVPLQTLTRQGTVVGTPYYMSPEQAQAFPDVDQRTDLYSAGAILYECLSGRAPHVGRAYEQVIVNICMHDAEDVRVHDSEVPEGIADFLRQALARERDDRFQSARDMLAALKKRSPLSISVMSSGPHLPAAFPSTPSLSGSEAEPSDPGTAALTPHTPLRGDTPKIVPAPASRPANELADTVGVTSDEDPDLSDAKGSDAGSSGSRDSSPSDDTAAGEDERVDGLAESGVSARITREPDTVRSQSVPPAARRKWPLALAPGIALLLAVTIFVSFDRSAEEEAAFAEDAEAAPAPAEEAAPSASPTTLAEAEPEAQDPDDEPDDGGEDEGTKGDSGRVAVSEGKSAGTAPTPRADRPAPPSPKIVAQSPVAKSPTAGRPPAVATKPPPTATATGSPPPQTTEPEPSDEPSLQLQTQ